MISTHGPIDFHQAHEKALFQDLIAHLRRQSDDLLSFDLVRESLRVHEQVDRGVYMIPVHKIVGSAGRSSDFNRYFMPREGIRAERWNRLDRAFHNREDFPPILVYQVGEVYFVEDGNHRVSVARAHGLKEILAHVIEIRSCVPLTPDITPERLSAAKDYAEFLHSTELGQSRPAPGLEATVEAGYVRLREHIDAHRRHLVKDRQRGIPLPEAAVSWYDQVYVPAVKTIRQLNLRCESDGRTEADMYLWLFEYMAELREQFGPAVDVDIAAADYARTYPRQRFRRMVRAAQRLVQRIVDPGAIPPVVEDLLDRLEAQERAAGGDLPNPVAAEPEENPG